MVQNSTFLPTILTQEEKQPVVAFKYIIMHIFDNIICMANMSSKSLVPFTFKMHVIRKILNMCASFQIRDFCILSQKIQDSGKSW